MSHQPSTVDQLKATASSAYESVTNSLNTDSNSSDPDPAQDPKNYKQDLHGNTVKKGDLKDKLNEAALGTSSKKEEAEGLVEKVLSYIPGLASTENKEEKPEVEAQPGPPSRPEHDVQVEQFLRNQYHSRSGDGMPVPEGGK